MTDKRFPLTSHHLKSVSNVSRAWVCLILLVLHRACVCETLFGKTHRLDDSLEDKTCKQDHVYLIFNARSAISCLSRCVTQWQSISIFYKSGNGACKCCSEPYATPNGLPTETGTKYYIIAPDPVCSNYLVSDPIGVEDSQLTESTYYCQQSPIVCVEFYGGNPTDTSAIHARLNSKGLLTGAWTAPLDSDAADYVQVDFRRVTTIAAIALQGRDPALETDGVAKNQWVTSFKVITSMNCVDFTYITNGTAAAMIFEGTSSPDQIVVRFLPVRIISRCVRINPVQYFGNGKALRFDVLGCYM